MYSKKSNRLLHVDAIRGVTMLLVVYNHIVTFCLPSPCLTEINSILLLFRMPLFFFISGYYVVSYLRALPYMIGPLTIGKTDIGLLLFPWRYFLSLRHYYACFSTVGYHVKSSQYL